MSPDLETITSEYKWSLVEALLRKKFLDAGIQDVSTSISIVHDLTEKHKISKGLKEMMKVTNIYKHEIVDTRA